MNDDVFTDGPLARHVSKDLSDTSSSLHRRNAYVVIALVYAARRGGARLSCRVPREPDHADGHRREVASARAGRAGDGPAGTRRAIVLAIACALAVWLLVRRW